MDVKLFSMIRYSSVIDKVAVRSVLTAALLFCGLASFAQTPGRGHELRFGYGGLPIGLALADGFGTHHDVDPWYWNSRDRFRDYRGTGYSIGVFTVQYNWNFNGKRAIGLNVGLDPVFGYVYDGLTDERKGLQKSFGIAIYPEYRRTWNPDGKVKVYLALSAGLGIGCYYNCKRDYDPGRWSYVPILQFTPVGLHFGGKVFGFAEITTGTYIYGGRAGIGYKF